ncbi:MAG: hypothetical protein ABSB69_00300 [Solirubrobacteraceae bacterium]
MTGVRRGALVVLLLALVEAVLLGGHLLHGGLYAEDWLLAAIHHQSGISGVFNHFYTTQPERPLGEVYLALTAALSATNPHTHSLWGLLTLLAAASSVYFLLRSLSLRTVDALAIVLLFMVFPFSDGAWLWYSASLGYLAIALAAMGGTLAVTGLRREGRAAVAYHLGALVLFAASVLTYQVAAALICLSVLVYLPRMPRRRAVLLWICDVAAVVLASGLPRVTVGAGKNGPEEIIPVRDWFTHAKLIAEQGLKVLAATIVPFGSPHSKIVLAAAVLIACVVALLAWSARAEPELRRWLLVAAAGAVVIVAAYVVFVPATISKYQPIAAGRANRVNMLASLGYVLIAFALAMTLATSVVRLLGRPPGWAPAIGLAIAALVFVGYVHRTRQDVAAWDRAGTIQRRELAQLKAAGRPASGTTIYTFAGVGATAVEVPVFQRTVALNSAVQLLWNDPTLHAYPIFAGTEMTCTATEVVPVPAGANNEAGPAQSAKYRQAVFYDFRSGRQQLIASAAECRQAVASFVPGRVLG